MTTGHAVELDGQYRLLREEAGAVVRQGRAQLDVVGTDAAEYLHSQLTNDIDGLEPGEGCYAALLDRKGHMRGDMRVVRVDTETIAIDMEAIALDAVAGHLRMYAVGHQAEMTDRSGERAVVSVAGPAAAALTGVAPLAAEHDNAQAELDGVAARAVRTDLGLDLVCATADVAPLLAALASRGVEEVGEHSLEIRRVESGRPRFGREMTTETIPQEAGINERAISFTKGCYIGQETVARLHYRGKPNRHLRGIKLGAPTEAGTAVRLGERELGSIGTAVLSPALGPIALAILRREAEPGDSVELGDSNAGQVVELPFDER